MMCLCACVSVCVALKEALQKTCLMQLLDFHLNVAIVLTSITFAFPSFSDVTSQPQEIVLSW